MTQELAPSESMTLTAWFQEQPTTTEYTTQMGLELLLNKNQLLKRVRGEFANNPSIANAFIGLMDQHEIDISFGFDLLTQIALHRRASLSTLVGLLRHHFKDESMASQRTADMLLRCAQAGLVTWLEISEEFVAEFVISAEVQEELDRFQYPLPMVIQPAKLHVNTDSAYLTVSQDSVILKKNHHDDDICLDHINRVNAIPLAINHDVARMVQNKWRNLDKRKPNETEQDFRKRKKAFEKYDRTARHVMGVLGQCTDRIYLTHKYDKRGRTYCQGYHVNYQGAPWNKAVIELADKELIT